MHSISGTASGLVVVALNSVKSPEVVEARSNVLVLRAQGFFSDCQRAAGVCVGSFTFTSTLEIFDPKNPIFPRMFSETELAIRTPVKTGFGCLP